MPKFPADAPQREVIRTLEQLGFQVVRIREHISMVRANADGTTTPLTLPNHARIKGSPRCGLSALRLAFRGSDF